MKRRIIFYGDSNTYGFDPRDMWGGRYDKEFIWTNILSKNTDYEAINRGENGREIPHTSSQYNWLDRMLIREGSFDLFAVMLGTNDLLIMLNANEDKITARMEEFLRFVSEHPSVKGKADILLISPIEVKLSGYQDADRFNRVSQDLGKSYKALAEKLNIHFADASEWGIGIAYDGVHFSEEGHVKFAQEMEKTLNMLFKDREI